MTELHVILEKYSMRLSFGMSCPNIKSRKSVWCVYLWLWNRMWSCKEVIVRMMGLYILVRYFTSNTETHYIVMMIMNNVWQSISTSMCYVKEHTLMGSKHRQGWEFPNMILDFMSQSCTRTAERLNAWYQKSSPVGWYRILLDEKCGFWTILPCTVLPCCHQGTFAFCHQHLYIIGSAQHWYIHVFLAAIVLCLCSCSTLERVPKMNFNIQQPQAQIWPAE